MAPPQCPTSAHSPSPKELVPPTASRRPSPMPMTPRPDPIWPLPSAPPVPMAPHPRSWYRLLLAAPHQWPWPLTPVLLAPHQCPWPLTRPHCIASPVPIPPPSPRPLPNPTVPSAPHPDPYPTPLYPLPLAPTPTRPHCIVYPVLPDGGLLSAARCCIPQGGLHRLRQAAARCRGAAGRALGA